MSAMASLLDLGLSTPKRARAALALVLLLCVGCAAATPPGPNGTVTPPASSARNDEGPVYAKVSDAGAPSDADRVAARKRPPPPREVLDIAALLPPGIEGGWQGEPIREVPPPVIPAGWHGLGIRYYASPRAREPWYRKNEKDERFLNEDRRKVVTTYLVWNDRTGEGLVLNPLASDAAFVIETAKAQKGVRWLHVIDSHTEFKSTPPLPGREQVEWERDVEFRGATQVHIRDADRTYREKKELFDAGPVAAALGATPITRGLTAPERTKSGKLLVFRTALDAPHWSFLEVQWGPFRFDGNWDGD